MVGIKFELIKHIGVLSESSTDWTKELNLISWNDRDPKFKTFVIGLQIMRKRVRALH